MISRSLGRSGLSITPIGLGMAALGRPGYINLGHRADLEADYRVEAMEARAHRILDAAWDAGIGYFDVARSYGRAEAFVSSWLETRNFQEHDFLLSSKWGYTYTADWEIEADAHEEKDHSLAVLERQIKESRDLLGNHLKLYQIHSATLDSGVLDNQPVLTRLHDLKQSGLKIGLSVSGANQSEVIRKALSIRLDGVALFDTCQATWNLLETSTTDALQEAHDAGLGIIIKEGLANGRLTSRNASSRFAGKIAILNQIAEAHQTSIDAIALAAILAQPWVDTVLSGAAKTEHLISNLEAVSTDLSEEEQNQLSNLSESSETYWRTRANLAWN